MGAMTGRILIYDGVAANRIVLRCKLSAACYDVSQATTYADIARQAKRYDPDLVILDLDDDPSEALGVCARIASPSRGHGRAVVLLSAAPTEGSRIDALEAGARTLLQKPLDDALLMATLRHLVREQQKLREARDKVSEVATLGLMEDKRGYAAQSTIGLIAPGSVVGRSWAASLAGTGLTHHITCLSRDTALMPRRDSPTPDVFVIKATLTKPSDGLRLLSELRSRPATQRARVIMVFEGPDAHVPDNASDAAIALDLGADDVLVQGFSAKELALKLDAQILAKQVCDRLRRSLQSGVEMAALDPLTGLHNRRYAYPRMQRMMLSAQSKGRPMALLALDIDRFKAVNDTHGHAVGDAVLIEVSKRLRAAMRSKDLLARSGGEEFWIAMADIDRVEAERAAQAFCDIIRADPVVLQTRKMAVRVTISIGFSISSQRTADGPTNLDELMLNADRALYAAKTDGRDKVTFAGFAA